MEPKTTKTVRQYIAELKPLRVDPEAYHERYDIIITERLRELDPKFVKALERASSGVSFWYA